MKKIISLICSILIMINLVIFLPNHSYGICNTFNFSKQVSAVKLTLANGHVLHDIRVDKNVNDQKQIFGDSYKRLNLVFLIETENNIYQNRTKLIPFIEKIYEFYGKNTDKIKMGIIPFEGHANNSGYYEGVEEIYKNSKEEVVQEITNLKQNNRISLETALKMSIEGGELKANSDRC